MANKSPPPELVESARRSLSRLTRFVNQLMREQMSCGPVTVQQCYTLEALVDGPLPMHALAQQVALHQSTVTRIVAKLEAQGLVERVRKDGDLRTVEVHLTDSGRETHAQLDKEGTELISKVLDLVPAKKRSQVVSALETVSSLVDPCNDAFMDLLSGCCAPGIETGINSADKKESAA